MLTTITIQRLSVGSVYQLWLIGLSALMMPLGVLCGVLAMFGLNTVHWNGKPLHGFVGLIAAPLMCLALTILITIFLGSICVVGLWMYSKFRPITLRVKNV